MYSPNTNSGLGSNHFELTDQEESSAVQSQALNAKKRFFQECFGPFNFDTLDSGVIVDKIFSVVDQTRASMQNLELHNVLNEEIQSRLEQLTDGDYRANALNTGNPSLNRNNRITAFVDAVFKAIPEDIMDQYLRLRIPTKPRIIEGNNMINIVQINFPNINGTAYNIHFDLDHPFWKGQDYRDPTDLSAALRNTTLSNIGIVFIHPSISLDRPIQQTTADIIANASFSTISIPPKRGVLTERVPADTRQVELEVDIEAMMNATMGPNALAHIGLTPYPNNYPISQLTEPELERLFQYVDPANGRHTYWESFVKSGNPRQGPNQLDSTGTRRLSEIVAAKVIKESQIWRVNRCSLNGVRYSINPKLFLSTKIGNDAFIPEDLRGKKIAELAMNDLNRVIQIENPSPSRPDQSFPYWRILVNTTSSPYETDRNDNPYGQIVIQRLSAYWYQWKNTKETVTLTGEVELKIKSDELLAANTGPDAPVGLQNRPVAGLTYSELRDLLRHRGVTGDFPFWKKYVDAGTKNPMDLPHGITAPTTTSPYPPNTDDFANRAALQLNAVIRGVARNTALVSGDIIGQNTTSLLGLHKEVRREHEESMAFVEKLKEGSVNTTGANIAAHLALQNPSIMARVQGGGDAKKLKEEVVGLKAKKNLALLLSKLRELTFSPSMKEGLDVLQKERDALRTDLQSIGFTTRATSWSSNFAIQGSVLPNSPVDLTGPNTPGVNKDSERRDAQNKITGQLKLVSDEIAKYDKTSDILIRIFIESQKAKLEEKMSAYIDGNKVDPSKLTSEETPIQIAEKLEKEFALESDDQLTEKIKKKEAELQVIEKGGDSGDALQLRIATEHFKLQGLSQKESEKCAKQLLAQGYISAELDRTLGTLSGNIFSDDLEDSTPQGGLEAVEEWFIDKANILQREREHNAVNRVASMLKVPTGFTRLQQGNVLDDPIDDRRIQWQRASYPNLVTAYFTFKELYEGTGPEYTKNLKDSKRIRDEMKIIAKVLTQKHAEKMSKELSYNLIDEERKELGNTHEKIVRATEDFLLGSAPEKYQPRINRILDHLDMKEKKSVTTRGKRALKATWAGVSTATLWSGSNALKATKKTAEFANTHKKTALALAACFALAGPLGVGAYYLVNA